MTSLRYVFGYFVVCAAVSLLVYGPNLAHAQALPDLTVGSVSNPSPLTVARGATLSVDIVIVNRTTVTSKDAHVALFLSERRILDRGDILLGVEPVPELGHGQIKITFNVVVPLGAPLGDFHLVAAVMAPAESRCSNNMNATRRQIKISVVGVTQPGQSLRTVSKIATETVEPGRGFVGCALEIETIPVVTGTCGRDSSVLCIGKIIGSLCGIQLSCAPDQPGTNACTCRFHD